jgi:hypothetical protein
MCFTSNRINFSITLMIFIGSVNMQLKRACVIENEGITLMAFEKDHYILIVPCIHE